jgi:hypothetical protein
MPKAFDLFPARRGRDDTHSPLKNLLDWTSPMDMTARDAGGRVNSAIEAAVSQAVDETVQWIKDNTGIDLSNIVALTDLIAQQLHFGDTDYWNAWFDNLTRMFDDLDFTSPNFNPAESWNIFVSTFLAPLGIVLTPSSPLDASKLLGQLFPGLFSNVPSTAITDADANLLTNGGFVGAIAVVGGGVWVLDQHVYYLVPGEDALTAGSVRVTADGTAKELRSNAVTVGITQNDQIRPGQKLAYSVDVLASGLTGAGTPVRMVAVTNLSSSTLAQSMPAGTDLTHWRNAPAGAKSATLTANYTVPDDGSVTWVRMGLVLDQSATVGASVWWDQASEKLTGGLISDLQAGYSDLHDDAVANQAADAAFLTAVKAAIDTHPGDWPGLMAALSTAYQTWTTTKSGLASAAIATLTTMLNELLGISPTTGTIATSKVDGLDDLNTDFAALQTESATQQAAWGTMMASWKATLNNGALDWPTKISQLESAFSTYQQVAQGVASAQVITVTSIINGLLGIDPATGSTQLAQVEGLDSYFTELGAALTGDSGTAAGPWAWLGQIISSYYALTGQAHSTAVANNNTLSIRTNIPAYVGLDNTAESNMPVTNIAATSIMQLTTASGSLIGFIRCQRTSTKGAVVFPGSSSVPGNTTAFYINVFRLDTATGNLKFLFSTGDIKTLLPTSQGWVRYAFPSAQKFAVVEGDVIAVELQGVGTTSAGAYGTGTATQVVADPTRVMPHIGGFRVAGTSPPTGDIASGSYQFSGKAPYVALEITDANEVTYPPVPNAYTTVGTSTQTVDTAWPVGFVDLVGIGGGGGGQGETGSTVGRGGSPGQWGTNTLTVGGTGANSIAAGGTITISVGDGGDGGPYFSDGSYGQNTTFQWHDTGGTLRTLTCPGGQGGGIANGNNLTIYGQAPSPATETYQGKSYKGGSPQTTGAPGYPPGGSGPGGQPFQYGFKGGRGQAWTVERYT